MNILRDFQHSNSITAFLVGDTPDYMFKFRDLETIIREQPWPKLKKIQITDQCNAFSCKDIQNLIDLCGEYGIQLDCDAIGYDDYSYDYCDCE
ncbi:uncharacterized protein MELLADRAFT_71748 [Melampsora larici-populina 98AG31]|uniref:Uncharacterized protein n=1 Tax=Melampsora larici-populina (strain 98AG31 / pathotype 3-4-7) TaxID=747676 RepID=F4RK30_MELLP|nr:uncharacterized protein MELLADRAFT_71748 [Melampsora larici-populina 98AG31]EGG07030.1 hypothetical protein MELLADRAFT_71748 [Melampsora larici-populina 98AG31]